MFAKGLLDKIGVKADYVQIGEYKGADEEFTRTQASDELRGELNKLADRLYDHIVDTISISRNMSRSDVRSPYRRRHDHRPGAKDRGLVDHLVDMDGLRDLLQSELGEKPDLVADYGQSPSRRSIFPARLRFSRCWHASAGNPHQAKASR